LVQEVRDDCGQLLVYVDRQAILILVCKNVTTVKGIATQFQSPFHPEQVGWRKATNTQAVQFQKGGKPVRMIVPGIPI
jgi:hypothetical protein